MAVLNGGYLGSFDGNINGVKVKFLADEINIVRKVNGSIVVSHYCAMSSNGDMWNKSWGVVDGNFCYCEGDMKSLEYVNALLKNAVQVRGYIDGYASFEYDFGKDYLSEIVEEGV